MLAAVVSVFLSQVVLPRAHSHNDYLRAKPLGEALEHGFASVEADIFLVDGVLLVAHERASLAPEKTLEKLYLKPLVGPAGEGRWMDISRQPAYLLGAGGREGRWACSL